MRGIKSVKSWQENNLDAVVNVALVLDNVIVGVVGHELARACLRHRIFQKYTSITTIAIENEHRCTSLRIKNLTLGQPKYKCNGSTRDSARKYAGNNHEGIA